jgi:AAA15 family ATPase/GTPase
MDFDKVLNSIPREDAEKIKIDLSNAANEHPIMFKIDEQVFELRKDENGNIVYNKLLLNHGNAEDMFDYNDESDGTKRLFDLIPLFYENRKVSLILIDEIDRSLHTNLTRKFLELFYEVVEERECQIIATTHDSNLLDLELLRQDEIWFVERQEDHSSKVFSLNRFKERFDKKIDKEYLIGRYGAIPVFDDKFVLEEIYEE